MRYQGYGILRGVPKDALNLEDLRFLGIHHSLEMVTVEEGAQAVGLSAIGLNLRKTAGVTMVAVVRNGMSMYEFADDFGFQVSDIVVLVGPGPALVKGTAIFRADSEDA